ncbi:MAG: histidine-type phosphatase [Muribaculaceae bacterium]|nr:histidine-type phosphatase [Muribaculaceae bacterium]
MRLVAAIVAAVLSAGSIAATTLIGFPEAAANYRAYPSSEQITPPSAPPAGYEAFHIEHYGRHGARWLIGDRYNYPVEVLEMAERNGALTPRGAEVLAELRPLRDAARGRDGELTAIGAEQHRGIARRMAWNFPTVFAPGTRLDARSTVVIRCILSMLNEVQELTAIYNDLNVTTDASEADMYYMNTPAHNPAWDRVQAVKDTLDAFRARYPVRADFAAKLISNPALIADSVDIPRLNNDIFDIAANSTSHGQQSDLVNIFSPDEIHENWLRYNAFWFWRYGNWDATGGIAANNQIELLRNVVLSADTALMSPSNSVNMRFGHEVNLIALVVMLEMDDYNRRYATFDEAMDPGPDGWHNYDVFPMAANIQLIFYRPRHGEYTADDILVKAMLNEREVSLPATPVEGSYYRWSDLRPLYLSKSCE